MKSLTLPRSPQSVDLTGKLHARQAFIKTTAPAEFIVRAILHDASLVQHQNAVGTGHSGQPVGNNQSRSITHNTFQRRLDERFIFSIKRARRLVEKQDRRIPQDGACNGDALTLPA